MAKPRQTTFGGQQLRIMQLLWERKRNAREITDALNTQPGHAPVAHSTVQTLLRQLEAKGAVAHDVEDRTFVFRACVEQGSAVRRAARDLVDRMFGGSLQGLVAHLIDDDRVSREELDAIQKLIARRRKEGK